MPPQVSGSAGGRSLRVHIVGENRGLKASLADSERQVEGFGGRVKRIGGQIARALGAAAVGAGVAVAGGLVASVKAFTNFDDAMTKSLAIMGDVSATMRGRLSDAAREVGKTTSFSASQAAEGYFFLASAGLDAEQQLAAMPRVAKFAQAGNFDLARATDLATDAQSALGMASDDAAENIDNLTRVTDVLIRANQNANASAEQFSEALTEKAGAALRSVGKDIEEGVAALSVFADQGIKGTAAGTTLTATLDGLSRNARANAEAFADLGVEVFDAEGNMNNLADVVGQLEDGMAGMSVEQREATLAALGFNRQARNGVLALLEQSDTLRGYEEDLRSAAGAVDEVADKQLESFKEQLGLVKDRLVDLGIEIGERVTPYLQGLAEWLNENGDAIADKVVGALDSLIGWWDDNGETLISWATSLKDTVVDAATTIKDTWDDTIESFEANSDTWVARHEKMVELTDRLGTWVERVLGLIGQKQDENAEATETWGGRIETVLGFLVDSQLFWADVFTTQFDLVTRAAERVGEAIQSIRENADELANSTGIRLLLRVGGTGALLSRLTGVTLPEHHSGGVFGTGGRPRDLGTRPLVSDEGLAVLRHNEEVLTPDDPRHVNRGGLVPAAGDSSAVLARLDRLVDLLERDLAEPRRVELQLHNPAPERASASLPRALATVTLAAGG